MKVVALCGKKHVGKSTVARHLVENHGFVEFAYADPLKAILSIALDVPIENFTDQNLKEEKIEYWGNTPRYFMQKWGTEIFRETIPKVTPEIQSIWIQLLEKKIVQHMLNSNINIVVSDCRFEDEVLMLKEKFGAFVINIERAIDESEVRSEAQTVRSEAHSSEKGITTCLVDSHILNNNTLPQFLKSVDIIMGYL